MHHRSSSAQGRPSGDDTSNVGGSRGIPKGLAKDPDSMTFHDQTNPNLKTSAVRSLRAAGKGRSVAPSWADPEEFAFQDCCANGWRPRERGWFGRTYKDRVELAGFSKGERRQRWRAHPPLRRSNKHLTAEISKRSEERKESPYSLKCHFFTSGEFGL